MKKRVLVACETSGVVREAFRKRGHHAVSCDLLPADDGSSFHIQNDILQVLATSTPFDLMIAHPTCTYLTNAGVRHLHDHVMSRLGNRTAVYGRARWLLLEEAIDFFNALKNANIPRICIENPIPHKYAREGGWYASQGWSIDLGSGIGKYTQIIQPWMFGHTETKATCLWLKDLPKLEPNHNWKVTKAHMENLPKNQQQRLHYLSPSKDRWKIRSRTFQGIADAMAEQWGDL